MGSSKNVLETVLQLAGIDVKEKKGVRPYGVFWGYAKLLSMGESTQQALLDKEGLADLETARRFFKEKRLDINLMKTGLPAIIRYLPSVEGNDPCYVLLEKVTAGTEDCSSYDLCSRILPAEDPMFTVFAEGQGPDGVFAYEKKLREENSKESPKENEERETRQEPDRSNSRKEVAEAEKKEDKGASDKGAAEKEHLSFEELSAKYRKLRIDLLDVVKGQNDAVLEFVQGCYQGAVLSNDSARKLPKAAFLFVGPPGVGKTLLAQTAAESLGYPCKTYNMSEYAADQSHEELIGVASFYNKSEEGSLVKFVRENPKCILIFDEIEKANRNVIQLFLQILDLGVLDNVHEKCKTEFKDTIIIFTSNACSSIYETNYGNISKTPKKVILNALMTEKNPSTEVNIFPPAICSRFASGNVIMFNHLSIRNMAQMVNEHFEKTADQIDAEYGYKVSIDRKLPLLFLFHQGAATDARIATRQSDKFIKNELFELSRQIESHKDLMQGIDTIRFEMDLNSVAADPEIENLFINKKTTEALVICKKEDQPYFALPQGYRVHFAESIEQIEKYLAEDISIVMIDLTCGLSQDGMRGISIDDYNSFGVKAFDYLMEEDSSLPIYLLDGKEPLRETDKNIYFEKGACGIISLHDATEDSVIRQIQEISEEIVMEEKGREFGKHGYIIDFNTAQIPDGTALRIQYHGLKKQQALDTESASKLVSDVERPKVKFEDVIGAENAKEELQYFIRYLSNPREFIRHGGKPAKGVLLYGPPGTGKTMLARAMAGESKVAFIETSATNFLSKYQGDSEKSVRDIFKKAKEFAPAIIFIDEIDAIGKQRTGESHTDSILNALLTEMDGFKVNYKKPVFVLAATNYQLESNENGRMALDPALVRRFDNRILVDLPNEKERYTYISRAAGKKGFEDIDNDTMQNIAERTQGLSIAVLQSVLDLAFRNAEREGRRPNGSDLQTALEDYNYGEKRINSEDYYRSVAIHESGHAFIAWKSGEKPSYMTIESRGDFGGYMAHESSENKNRFSKEDLIWRIRCSLAGRAAEEVFYGKETSLNTGASSDLKTATRLALSMICDYGMMEGQLIALPFEEIAKTSLAPVYLDQANKLLGKEMKTTVELIEEGRDKVKDLADHLVKANHLTGDEILDVLKD